MNPYSLSAVLSVISGENQKAEVQRPWTMEMETMLELESEAKPKPHTPTLPRPEPPLAIQAINKVQ